ncbi:MAG: TlpA disulfide reductase family protein [Burkholderiales bacterium]
MNKIRDRLALIVAVSLGVGSIYLGSTWNREPTTQILPADVLSPGALYTSSFPDLEGKVHPLGEWQGKIMVLNLWATWCGPCREEIPIMVKLHQKYREQGVTFIGLAMDEKGPVEKYAKEMGINYPILLGDITLGDFGRRLGNNNGGLPYTVIIDRAGKIVTTRLGGVDEKFLEQVLHPLLQVKT